MLFERHGLTFISKNMWKMKFFMFLGSFQIQIFTEPILGHLHTCGHLLSF